MLFGAIVGVGLALISARASDNRENDYLLSVSPDEQAKLLGKVVGKSCIGTKAFYQGGADVQHVKPNQAPAMSGHEHDAVWNLKCSNGKSYVVLIFPDGKSQTLPCSSMAAAGGGKCFEKFK